MALWVPQRRNRIELALARGAARAFGEALPDAHSDPEPLSEYANDFPAYFRDILHERVWQGHPDVPGQRGILESLHEHDRTMAATGTGVGKTWLIGRVAHAWEETQRNALCLILSKTWDQVEQQVFAELRAAHAKALKHHPSLPGRAMRTRFEIGPKWFAQGLSPRDPENAAGWHAQMELSPEAEEQRARWLEMSDEEFFALALGDATDGRAPVLAILDEASGIPDPIFDAVEGILTGLGCKLLVTTNITRGKGRVFKMWSDNPPTTPNRVCFDDEEPPEDMPKVPPRVEPEDSDTPDHARVNVLRLTSFDVPPAIVDRKFIERMRHDCGPKYWRNPRYMVKVLALPPLGGENSIFPLELLEACADLRPGVGGRHMGVDLNFGGGDWSIAVLEVNGRTAARYAWQVQGPMLDNYDAAQIIVTLAKGWRVEPKNCHPDATGAGAPVCDILRRVHNFPCDDVNLGAGPVGEWRHLLGEPAGGLLNRKHELVWIAHRRLQEGLLAIPDKAEYGPIISQLSAMQFDQNHADQFRPERNAVYIAREGRSPDDAIAQILAGARTQGTRAGLRVIKRRPRRAPMPRSSGGTLDPGGKAF